MPTLTRMHAVNRKTGDVDFDLVIRKCHGCVKVERIDFYDGINKARIYEVAMVKNIPDAYAKAEEIALSHETTLREA